MSGLRVIISEKKSEIYFPKTQSDIFTRMSQALLETIIHHPLITILKDTTILPIQSNDEDIIGIEAQRSFNPDQAQSYHTNIHVIKAKKTFIATGVKEQGFVFPGNHMGGIFTPQTYNDYHHLFGLNIEKNIVLYVNNDKAYDILSSANLTTDKINGIIDQRSETTEAMQKAIDAGYSLYKNAIVTQLQGKNRPEIVTFQAKGADKQNNNPKNIECEVLIQSSGYHLDLDIYRNNLDHVNAEIAEDASEIFSIEQGALGEKCIIAGYGTGKTSYSDLLKETYIQVKAALEKSGYKVEFPETASEHLSKETHLCASQFIHFSDKRLIDKTYFPYDIRFSDLRDAILKDQDAIDILSYFTDMKMISENQNIVFRIVSEIAYEYNFTAEKKYDLFLKTYQKLYETSESYAFYAFIKNIALIGHVYPALYAAYRQYGMPVSTDKREIKPQTLYYQGDKDKLTQIYNEIKENYAVRDLSFSAGPFILTGPDSAILLEKSFDVSILDLAIGKSRTIHISLSDKRKIALDIAHSQHNYFFLTSHDCAHHELKEMLETQLCSNNSLKFSLGDQFEQINMVHILGNNAENALSFLDIALEELSEKDDSFLNIWYKNIEIQLLHKKEFGLTSLYLFIPSDAIADLFVNFFEAESKLQKQIFDQEIIDILSFESGTINKNTGSDVEKQYPYKMFALPLSKNENITENMSLLESKDDKLPIGIITQITYSPLLKKDIAEAILSVEPEKIENKTIFAYHKEEDILSNITLLSPENITQKELQYE